MRWLRWTRIGLASVGLHTNGYSLHTTDSNAHGYADQHTNKHIYIHNHADFHSFQDSYHIPYAYDNRYLNL